MPSDLGRVTLECRHAAAGAPRFAIQWPRGVFVTRQAIYVGRPLSVQRVRKVGPRLRREGLVGPSVTPPLVASLKQCGLAATVQSARQAGMAETECFQ